MGIDSILYECFGVVCFDVQRKDIEMFEDKDHEGEVILYDGMANCPIYVVAAHTPKLRLSPTVDRRPLILPVEATTKDASKLMKSTGFDDVWKMYANKSYETWIMCLEEVSRKRGENVKKLSIFDSKFTREDILDATTDYASSKLQLTEAERASLRRLISRPNTLTGKWLCLLSS